jgi:hypothetical protein
MVEFLRYLWLLRLVVAAMEAIAQPAGASLHQGFERRYGLPAHADRSGPHFSPASSNGAAVEVKGKCGHSVAPLNAAPGASGLTITGVFAMLS